MLTHVLSILAQALIISRVLMKLRIIKRKILKIRRRASKLLPQRGSRKQKILMAVLATVLLFGMLKIYSSSNPTQVDPQSYGSLLSTIAKGESRGNYNAYYGKVANTDIDFTRMTIVEVLQWQEDFVKKGSPSSAVGKYQIVRPTLNGLVKQLDLSQDQRFDAAMQDRMAIALLERRGAVSYIDNKLSREQFAANIAKEWAALPKVIGDSPDKSYYDGDGLNKALISVDEVTGAVEQLKKM